MKTYSILACAFACLMYLSSCRLNSVTGTGNIVTQTPAVTAFEEIEIESSCDVVLYQGTDYKVELTDYENLLQYHKVEVVGNKLIIRTYPDNISMSNSKAKAVITMPDHLKKITIAGSSDVVLQAGFKDIEELNVEGSGNIRGIGAAVMNTIHATVEGSGDISMTGTATVLDLSIEGSGDIDFANVKAQAATCTIDGSGDITVNAANSLSATINGSGDILYYGNPTVSQKINGSGRVVKR
ncbi:MAG: head GIN domain-containing protein [Candidatus Kapaibacterium sp.]